MLPLETHQVTNTVPKLKNDNVYESDLSLKESVKQHLSLEALKQLSAYGQFVGGEMRVLGRQANESKPILHQFDHAGNRIDWVEYHPAYHQIMSYAVSAGLHSLPWEAGTAGWGHTLRAALMYLHSQSDAGTACPLSMTYAARPVLAQLPAPLKELFMTKLLSRYYDPENKPYEKKAGLLFGMSMTEKQGGSDIRANQTNAVLIENHSYALTGHKWFCSAPMNDAFLMTAQTQEGLSCFLVPRWRDEQYQNTIYIQRLKDKLGNRSNASSEIELKNAMGYLVGKPGQGIKTIMEMVMLTRFDCMVGSTSIMRQALVQAYHHALHRKVFGQSLSEQPLMMNVLADMQLEIEGNLFFCMRLAKALDHFEDEHEKHLLRILTTVGKYWICKSAPWLINEAQEALGGLGYVEESLLPRLYREAPLNSIWEGCGNIQCLDLMRIIKKTPETILYLLDFLEKYNGYHEVYDSALNELKQSFQSVDLTEHEMRALMQSIFFLFSASQLMENKHPLASCYIVSKLKNNAARYLGSLHKKIAFQEILDRIYFC